MIWACVLPWPPKECSPNARPHWRKKADAVRGYKADCIVLLMAAGVRLMPVDRLQVQFTFRPKRAGRHDTDNMIASVKAAIDAVSFVTGVDDSRFDFRFLRGEPIKGGAVEVVISHV